VQAKGGTNVAPLEWLCELAELCQRHGILLIVDDVQMGCAAQERSSASSPPGASRTSSACPSPSAVTAWRMSRFPWDFSDGPRGFQATS
jgi:bifunctional pyridoxal-dependent enzyme with beta-cystathionase and maltose regulon repressor activities